jgi:hypothetical protein
MSYTDFVCELTLVFSEMSWEGENELLSRHYPKQEFLCNVLKTLVFP